MSDLDDALYYARGVGMDDRDIAVAVKQAAAAHRAVLQASGLVTMTHPDLPDQPIHVPEDVVPGHEDSGWVRQAENDTQPELPPALVDVELPEVAVVAPEETEET